MTAGPSWVDPFDLPDWLGEAAVTWTPDSGIGSGHLIAGTLSGHDHASIACDLLAVDDAYPAPVAGDDTRVRTHQSWQHGEIQLATYDGRLTLLAPGTGFDADRVLDVVGRLAKALGASPSTFAVHLRLADRGGQ